MCRRAQFGTLALAAVVAWAVASSAACAAVPQPTTLPGALPGRGQEAAPPAALEGEAGRPVLGLPGPAPQSPALSNGRSATQVRADLRHPGLQAWRAGSVSGPGVPPPVWGPPRGLERPAFVRPPLHVVLCTWLT